MNKSHKDVPSRDGKVMTRYFSTDDPEHPAVSISQRAERKSSRVFPNYQQNKQGANQPSLEYQLGPFGNRVARITRDPKTGERVGKPVYAETADEDSVLRLSVSDELRERILAKARDIKFIKPNKTMFPSDYRTQQIDETSPFNPFKNEPPSEAYDEDIEFGVKPVVEHKISDRDPGRKTEKDFEFDKFSRTGYKVDEEGNREGGILPQRRMPKPEVKPKVVLRKKDETKKSFYEDYVDAVTKAALVVTLAKSDDDLLFPVDAPPPPKKERKISDREPVAYTLDNPDPDVKKRIGRKPAEPVDDEPDVDPTFEPNRHKDNDNILYSTDKDDE